MSFLPPIEPSIRSRKSGDQALLRTKELVPESYGHPLAKGLNVLDAIMWLKAAWDNVEPTTIQKCFTKCGFTQAIFADPEEDTTCTIDTM
jgi:hypothetical protein